MTFGSTVSSLGNGKTRRHFLANERLFSCPGAGIPLVASAPACGCAEGTAGRCTAAKILTTYAYSTWKHGTGSRYGWDIIWIPRPHSVHSSFYFDMLDDCGNGNTSRLFPATHRGIFSWLRMYATCAGCVRFHLKAVALGGDRSIVQWPWPARCSSSVVVPLQPSSMTCLCSIPKSNLPCGLR